MRVATLQALATAPAGCPCLFVTSMMKSALVRKNVLVLCINTAYTQQSSVAMLIVVCRLMTVFMWEVRLFAYCLASTPAWISQTWWIWLTSWCECCQCETKWRSSFSPPLLLLRCTVVLSCKIKKINLFNIELLLHCAPIRTILWTLPHRKCLVHVACNLRTNDCPC